MAFRVHSRGLYINARASCSRAMRQLEAVATAIFDDRMQHTQLHVEEVIIAAFARLARPCIQSFRTKYVARATGIG